MKQILLSPCTECFSAESVQARPEAGSLCYHRSEEAQYQLRHHETLLSARKNQNAEPTTARPLSDEENIPQYHSDARIPATIHLLCKLHGK